MYYNFVCGPFFITPEHLTPIALEFVKFREVSDRNEQKSTKGVYLVKLGVQIAIFKSTPFQNILWAVLLKEEAT